MGETPYQTRIPVERLRLDGQNPRLPEVKDSQSDILLATLQAQQNKMLALAQHIVEHGPNPTNLLIVMPSEQEQQAFVVLDGNRRVAALQLLQEPSLAEGVLNAATVSSLRALSARFCSNPVTELSCVVVADRDEADTWIPLIHRGEQKGAGIVEWDGQVAARYDERKGTKSAALQVLDFVREHATLPQKARDRIDSGRFPITNLSRLLNTPYVRQKLGIEKEAERILTYHPEAEVLKGLSRLVDDIGSSRITVSRIKSQAQRIDYITSLDSADLPDPASRVETPTPLGEPTAEERAKAPTPPEKRGAPVQRHTLIPGGCRLSISQPKINRLYQELKRLRLDSFPNAGAVLLRVFVELSLDQYLEDKAGWPSQQTQNSFMKNKLRAAANHMEKGGTMSKAQLRPVQQAAGGQTLLASSVKTMNGYVHSRYFSAIASELTTAWDDLQPFIENLWSGL
jgi:hypothetical protein